MSAARPPGTVTWLQPDDHPVLPVLVDTHAQDLRVERRERTRIEAVEHGLLQSADHTFIMKGTSGNRSRAGCLTQAARG
jgi:hypothetical protein